VNAFVIKMTSRKIIDVYGAEDLIEGTYIKHSDNNGWVASGADQIPMRNTPHAFSHFTYEASGHRFIVVDIQGVNDYYTDPQIHTVDRKGFGLGNLGQDGINKFLETHKCNPICQFLGLPPVRSGGQHSSLGNSGNWVQPPYQEIQSQFQHLDYNQSNLMPPVTRDRPISISSDGRLENHSQSSPPPQQVPQVIQAQQFAPPHYSPQPQQFAPPSNPLMQSGNHYYNAPPPQQAPPNYPYNYNQNYQQSPVQQSPVQQQGYYNTPYSSSSSAYYQQPYVQQPYQNAPQIIIQQTPPPQQTSQKKK